MSTTGGSDGLQRFRHIVIEGPIGVGKSSLARRLAACLGADLLLEQPEENPFLGRFYDDMLHDDTSRGDMQSHALQTQLFFLFQRVGQMQAAAQPGMFASAVVSDFLFAKDRLFARLNLGDDELRLYAQVAAQLAPQVREPDLVIWLQAGPGTLLQRIRKRAIPMEQGITGDYLERLCNAYVEHFRSYRGAPVFAVDTEHFNPVDSDADFDTLLRRLHRSDGARAFLGAPPEPPIR